MSEPIKDGGPAFPDKRRIHRAGYATEDFEPVQGMSMRDYFAASALSGIISNPAVDHTVTYEEVSVRAFQQADAMLATRSKP